MMSASARGGLSFLGVGLVIGLIIGGGASYLLLGQASGTTTTTTVTTTTETVTAPTTATTGATLTSTSSSSSSPSSSGGGTPVLPAAVPVSVDPKTTAVLILDYTFCYRLTGCNATLPSIQGLLSSARSAGVPIIYTRTPIPKEIANQTGDTVITNDVGPDKFLNTSLASILQSKGIKTVVIAGIAANGALLYTAQESCVRHYTVVVPLDTVIGTAYVQAYVPYQLLNGPGCANPNNTALSLNHATISTTSGITFKAGV